MIIQAYWILIVIDSDIVSYIKHNIKGYIYTSQNMQLLYTIVLAPLQKQEVTKLDPSLIAVLWSLAKGLCLRGWILVDLTKLLWNTKTYSV